MRRTLLLLSLVLIPLFLAQQDEGAQEYGNIIRTECTDSEIIVTVDYNLDRVHAFITSTSARRLEQANVTLGEECAFRKDRENKIYHLDASFKECGIQEKRMDPGVRYSGTVLVRTGSGPHMQTNRYHVSCSFMKNNTATTRFEVYNGKDQMYRLGSIETVNTALNEELKFQISPVFTAVSREFPELFVYPATCYLDNFQGTSAPVPILEKGCPVFDPRKKCFLSSIFQASAQVYSAETTEVRVVVGNQVLPDGRGPGKTDLLFGCDVFFCTSELKHRIKGIPLCPSAAPCNRLSGEQRILSEGSAEVGGGSTGVKLVSARLNLPIRVDMTVSGGISPIQEAIPRAFPVNVTRPTLACGENESSVALYVVVAVVCLLVGFAGGAACTRFTTPGIYLISESSSRRLRWLVRCPDRQPLDTTRCGSAVSQADAAPQPYVKLESSPAVLLSSEQSSSAALA